MSTSGFNSSHSNNENSYYIPIRDSHECVRVDLSLFPSDPHDLIDLLKLELAHPALWLKFAIEYYRRGLINEYNTILSVVTGPEAQEAYKSEVFKLARIHILNSLAAYEIELSTNNEGNNNDPIKQANHYSKAVEHLNYSTELDIHVSWTWAGKAILLFYQGNYSASLNNFNNSINSDINRENSIAHLGRALCLIYTGKYNEALKSYKQALLINPSLPGCVRLGFGYCYYKLNNIPLAIKSFQRVLSLDPNNVNGLLGLAILKLNQAKSLSNNNHNNSKLIQSECNELISSAYNSLQQAYNIDPNNIGVLNILCSYYFYHGDYDNVKNISTRAIETLNKQYNSQQIQNNELLKQLKGNCLFELGRTHHAQGDLNTAKIYYEQAIDLLTINNNNTGNNINKTNINAGPIVSNELLLFCYGQCLLSENQLESAKKLYLQLYNTYNNDFYLNRILGSIYLILGDYIESADYFMKSVKFNPRNSKFDAELLTELATSQQLACANNHNNSINNTNISLINTSESYLKAIQLFNNLDCPKSLYNNLAVAFHQMNDIESASKYYKKAINNPNIIEFIEFYSNNSNIIHTQNNKLQIPQISADLITILYNYALLLEFQYNYTGARCIYIEIIRSCPQYIDAELRLGKIEYELGHNELAIQYFQSALTKQPNSIATLTELGLIYIKQKQFQQAQKQFMAIMKETTTSSINNTSTNNNSKNNNNTGDSYAKLALGNIQYYLGHESQLKSLSYQPSDQRYIQYQLTSQEQYDKSGRFYRSVLDKNPNNIYAANGLGLILISFNKYSEAKDIFQSLKDVKPDSLDININLANAQIQLGQFNQGIKIYNTLLEKLDSNNNNIQNINNKIDNNSNSMKKQLLLYLARAHYLSSNLLECELILKKLIYFEPENLEFQYNLALTKEEFSINILQKNKNERTLNQVQQALNSLKVANNLFVKLQLLTQASGSSTNNVTTTNNNNNNPTNNNYNFLHSKSVTHSQFCRFALEQAAPHLQLAKQREEELKLLHQQSEQTRIEYELKLETEKKENELKLLQQKQQQQELAKAKQLRLQEIQQEWLITQKLEQEKEKEKLNDNNMNDFIENKLDETQLAEEIKLKQNKKKNKHKKSNNENINQTEDSAEDSETYEKKAKKRKSNNINNINNDDNDNNNNNNNNEIDNSGGGHNIESSLDEFPINNSTNNNNGMKKSRIQRKTIEEENEDYESNENNENSENTNNIDNDSTSLVISERTKRRKILDSDDEVDESNDTDNKNITEETNQIESGTNINNVAMSDEQE